MPNWLSNRNAIPPQFNWGWVIHYSVGKIYLEGGGAACGTCETVGTGGPPLADGSLSVNGTFGKQVVIIMTGPAGTGPLGGSRPLDGLGTGICTQAQWAAYVDDGPNNDINLIDDRYVTPAIPASKAHARDRLYTIP
jgi:hypothetical protein